jgi:hypothetical protein
VRRAAAVVVALTALAAAGPAAAFLPPVPSGSSVGDGVPLKAYASVAPTVHLFGDELTAKVAVVADTKWVLPARLRVSADFSPYTPVHAPAQLRVGSGRFQQITWTWTLRCTTLPCVPREPPSDKYRVFRFHPAHIDYLDSTGKSEYGITASFPAVETLSQVTPGLVAYLTRHNALNWSYRITPVAAPSYRVSPGLVFWLALGLGGGLALAGAGLLGRWALRFRPHAAAAAAPGPPATALERALSLFVWARERGDDTLQRKALERVADELAPAGLELSERARTLAWAPETPPEEEVAELSESALHRTPRPEEEQP